MTDMETRLKLKEDKKSKKEASTSQSRLDLLLLFRSKNTMYKSFTKVIAEEKRPIRTAL